VHVEQVRVVKLAFTGDERWFPERNLYGTPLSVRAWRNFHAIQRIGRYGGAWPKGGSGALSWRRTRSRRVTESEGNAGFAGLNSIAAEERGRTIAAPSRREGIKRVVAVGYLVSRTRSPKRVAKLCVMCSGIEQHLPATTGSYPHIIISSRETLGMLPRSSVRALMGGDNVRPAAGIARSLAARGERRT
jgi:hypothetical protein